MGCGSLGNREVVTVARKEGGGDVRSSVLGGGSGGCRQLVLWDGVLEEREKDFKSSIANF